MLPEVVQLNSSAVCVNHVVAVIPLTMAGWTSTVHLAGVASLGKGTRKH